MDTQGLCDIKRWTDVIRCEKHGHHHNHVDADDVLVDNVDDIVMIL